MSYKFKWVYCPMCGWTPVCPSCNMNWCSGGYGEGGKCKVCPSVDVHAKKGFALMGKETYDREWTKEQVEAVLKELDDFDVVEDGR